MINYSLKSLINFTSFLNIEVGDFVYIARSNSKEYIDENFEPWELKIAGFSVNSIGKQKGFYLLLSSDSLPQYIVKRVNMLRVGKDVFFNKESVEYAYKRGYEYMKDNPTIYIRKDSNFVDINLERIINNDQN